MAAAVSLPLPTPLSNATSSIINLGHMVQSDLAYPVLFYPDPSPSGRKSLDADLQHMSCILTVCVFNYRFAILCKMYKISP